MREVDRVQITPLTGIKFFACEQVDTLNRCKGYDVEVSAVPMLTLRRFGNVHKSDNIVDK